MPLHGAFLIDGNGLVRWQDIRFEPFMDAPFLLAESKRLLAQMSASHTEDGRRKTVDGIVTAGSVFTIPKGK